jgi:hypothetical protein
LGFEFEWMKQLLKSPDAGKTSEWLWSLPRDGTPESFDEGSIAIPSKEKDSIFSMSGHGVTVMRILSEQTCEYICHFPPH